MKKWTIIRYVFLIVLSLLWLSPILTTMVFSFAPNSDILLMRLLPTKFTLDNYASVIRSSIRGVSIPSSMINSTIVMVLQTAGILLLDIPAAYALGRLQFKGRNVIFWMILITMMMPGHIILISLYEIMAQLGFVDTLQGIILPGLPRVLGIFLLRQFFMGIPDEMEDAARVDGASMWQTFLRIMVPIAKPAIATLTILTALYSWNNFLWPLVITNTPGSMTVPIAVAYLRSGTIPAQNYATMLAAAFFTSLPMIGFFLVAQKWIVAGIAPTSGIK